MILSLNVPDRLIESMKAREGLSTSRILNEARRISEESEDENGYYNAEELREIEPLVNALYSALRSAVLFPPKT